MSRTVAPSGAVLGIGETGESLCVSLIPGCQHGPYGIRAAGTRSAFFSDVSSRQVARFIERLALHCVSSLI